MVSTDVPAGVVGAPPLSTQPTNISSWA